MLKKVKTYRRKSFNKKGLKNPFEVYTYIPLGLAMDSFDEDWERSLMFFIELSVIYKNKKFFDYNPNKLSNIVKRSPSYIRKHVNILEERGLVYQRDGHLCLVGSQKLKEAQKHNKMLVPVAYHENLSDRLNLLRYTIIKRRIHLQKCEIDKIVDFILMHEGKLDGFSKLEIKKLIKKRDKHNLSKILKSNPEKLLNVFTTLSNETIGKLFNRERQTGLSIQKELNRLGLIKSVQRIRILRKNMTMQEFLLAKEYGDLPASVQLGKNGEVFQQLSNIIILTEDIKTDLKSHITKLYSYSDESYLVNFFESKTKTIAIESLLTDEYTSKMSTSRYISAKEKEEQRLKEEKFINSILSTIKPFSDNDIEYNKLSRPQKAKITIINKYKGNYSLMINALQKRTIAIEEYKRKKTIERLEKNNKRLGISLD